jgi:metallo-beta-lactamase class B
MAKARALAGPELRGAYEHRCGLAATYSYRTAGLQPQGLIDPVKAFDNLYFVGQMHVSAWLVPTSDGLVLFDALDNLDEAQNIVESGLRKLGFDPALVKYMVITHGHSDHFGGAKYFREKYGTRLMASVADWEFMNSQRSGPSGALVPDHGLDITDGQRFTLGDTTFTFYVTPGHTPGTVSTTFRVTDQGTPHVVAYWGGNGFPNTAEALRTMRASLGRFGEIATAAGADVLLGNHQHHDDSLMTLEELRYRLPQNPNPAVQGKNVVTRFFPMMQECIGTQLARMGEN